MAEENTQSPTASAGITAARRALRIRYAIEWLIIVLVATLYGGVALLDFDPAQLQLSYTK